MRYSNHLHRRVRWPGWPRRRLPPARSRARPLLPEDPTPTTNPARLRGDSSKAAWRDKLGESFVDGYPLRRLPGQGAENNLDALRVLIKAAQRPASSATTPYGGGSNG